MAPLAQGDNHSTEGSYLSRRSLEKNTPLIMTKQEVTDFLKRDKKRWFTSYEIADACDIGRAAISANLRKLRKDGFINSKEIRNPFNSKAYLYKHKR